MREQVRLAGGACEIITAPGRGTTVRASIPVTERP
jgi:signal transduction histidine kinase